MAIDFDHLPYGIFRPIWDFIILGFGIYMLIRIRTKIDLAHTENLESRIRYLSKKQNEQMYQSLLKKLKILESRIEKIETSY
jgi:hypothetical protein